MSRPHTVLVLGSTGQVGKLVARELEADPGIHLRVTSRRRDEVDRLRAEGKDAVFLDLDEPKTFGPALAGVDRLFLLTGYSVAMLVQSKTLIDAAKKVGVRHVVHLGVFADWDCTDPHFAWHILVQSYLESSGMAWTELHPNMFMENLLSFFAPVGDALTLFWEQQRMGWIAAADIAAVAAAALAQGPERHGGQHYWMSTEALDGTAVAAVLSEVTGRAIRFDRRGPDAFDAIISAPGSPMEAWYGKGAAEFMRQVVDGRMGNISSVRDDVPHVTGRAALTLREWARQHRDELVAAASRAAG